MTSHFNVYGLGSFPMAALSTVQCPGYHAPTSTVRPTGQVLCHHHTEAGADPQRNRRLSLSHLLLPQLCEIKNRCLTQGKQTKVQLGKYFPHHPFLAFPPEPKYSNEVSFTLCPHNCTFPPLLIRSAAHIQQKRFLTSRSQACWRGHSPRGLVACWSPATFSRQTSFASSASSALPLLGLLFPLGSPIRFFGRRSHPIQP